MKCLLAIVLSIAAISSTLGAGKFADADARELHMPADTDTLVRKQSVSVGVTYGTNAVFFGRTSPRRYPFYTADVIYNSKSGFFAYSSIWKVNGSYPTLDEVDLGGGYVYHFSKRSKGSVSYTHFFFNRNAQIIRSQSTNNIDFKNTYDWTHFRTSVAFDYLFGKASDIFVTPSISKWIEPTWSVFDKKDYLTFNPSVSAIFGTQNFVERYANNERADRGSDNGFVHELDNNQTALGNRQLKVMNYSFRLPIAYNRPHYTLEVNPRYSIPVNVPGSLKNRRDFFLNVTFYYLFF